MPSSLSALSTLHVYFTLSIQSDMYYVNLITLLLQISMQLLLAMLIIVSHFHIIAALEDELYIKKIMTMFPIIIINMYNPGQQFG